jgi:hypothetical protein
VIFVDKNKRGSKRPLGSYSSLEKFQKRTLLTLLNNIIRESCLLLALFKNQIDYLTNGTELRHFSSTVMDPNNNNNEKNGAELSH